MSYHDTWSIANIQNYRIGNHIINVISIIVSLQSEAPQVVHCDSKTINTECCSFHEHISPSITRIQMPFPGPLQSTAIKGGHAVAGAPQRASALQMTLTSEETDKSGGMSARVGKRGKEGPGESTMSGFHHLPEDPLREGGPCERDTVAPGGGRRDERREGEGQVVTRESIGKIVKHEMKKILKVCVHTGAYNDVFCFSRHYMHSWYIIK